MTSTELLREHVNQCGEVRVLLAVEPPLLRDLLSHTIAEEPGMEVVGEVADGVGVLLAVARTGANVVVHSNIDNSLSSTCSHLFAEYPGLLVIGLHPEREEAVMYRQEIVESSTTANIDGLCSAIRSHCEPLA